MNTKLMHCALTDVDFVGMTSGPNNKSHFYWSLENIHTDFIVKNKI